MKIIFILGIIFLLLFTIVLVSFDSTQLNKDDNILEDTERLYQGPVQEGYDKEYFRQTGITKPIK